jgi:ribosomal protein S18 acetylase RimI-like enzyme
MNITLILIKISDKSQVLTLFKEAAEKIAKKNIDHWQYWKNPPTEKIEWVEEGISNNEFFFVQDPHQQTIGMVRILEEDILYWGKQTAKAKYIHSLVVIEAFEGRAIGKMILQKIEKDALKNGYTYLRLDSDAKNPKLCRYYVNQGFEKVGIKTLALSAYNLYQKRIL